MTRRCRNCTWVWLVLLVAAATAVAGLSSMPESASVIIYLNGPSDWDRKAVYHKDEGTRLFPYDWFLALERADSTELFASDDNIRRYAFLPDPDDAKNNPDRLPVGFTKYDPMVSKVSMDDEFACGGAQGATAPPLPQLGFNCAACHTSELRYTNPKTGHRSVFRIEGGPSMQNNLKFFMDLREALKATASNNEKLVRFVGRLRDRLSKSQAQQALSHDELGACVVKYLRKRRLESYNGAYPTDEAIFPSPWGFGRLDAFGRGGNTIFAKLDPDNLRPAYAPVSIPPLWSGVWKYDWVQWNGAIHDLQARYITQAIGLNAPVRLDVREPARLFETGFDLQDMKWLAEQYKKLSSPVWPSDIFDDSTAKDERTKLATLGKDLYEKRCASCHAPHKGGGDRFLLKTISVSNIGTDPAAATNFYDRMVKTGALSQKQGGPLKADALPAVEVAEYLTTRIMEKNGLDASANTWVARWAYLARPHAGVWATAPFLHNGSTPNLYLLLSPQEERDARAKTFCLGDLEFDPKQVGFKLKRPPCADGEDLLDTSIRGNWNTGHEYRNDDRAGNRFSRARCDTLLKHAENGILGCELTRDERMAIVEYLKTL